MTSITPENPRNVARVSLILALAALSPALANASTRAQGSRSARARSSPVTARAAARPGPAKADGAAPIASPAVSPAATHSLPSSPLPALPARSPLLSNPMTGPDLESAPANPARPAALPGLQALARPQEGTPSSMSLESAVPWPSGSSFFDGGKSRGRFEDGGSGDSGRFSGDDPWEPLPGPAGAGENGKGSSLILVQIDGLGYDRLQEAMAKGHVPHLKTLLERQGYRLARFSNGLPTVTMAVQTALFYGKLIPGNEWYSKRLGREITANELEMELPVESGLMHGGETHLSEISGGALRGADVRRIFMEDRARGGLLRAVLKELSIGLPLFLRYHLSHNPFLSPPLLLHGILRDIWRMRRDFRAKGFQSPLDKKAPFFISLIGNLWSPIALEGIKDAIRRNLKAAYADFSNYDELAHYYGTSSPEAFATLSRIDSYIGEIVRAARRKGARLLIFSDHGQTPAKNFIREFGRTPQQVVDELARQSSPSGAAADLVFSHVYSMGNIYLRAEPGRLDLETVEAKYPGLAQRLAEHPGFGMVAARSKGRISLLGRRGLRVFNRDGKVLVSRGQDPLSPYLDPQASADTLRTQIANYLDIEESGDLVVFAPFKDGISLDLNPNYTLASQHGGLGGEQGRPFLINRQDQLPLDPESMIDARDLHRQIKPLIRP